MDQRGQARLDEFLGALLFAGMILALYMAFLQAPREKTMGDLQRIFYFHVSSGITGLTAFAVNFAASVMYLVRRNRWWDHVALSSAELGVMFLSIVLVTGPIWAKPVWFVWWTWSPRLTSSLVLWMLYVAYLLVRNYVLDPDRRALVSAVFGIVYCVVFDSLVAGHPSSTHAGDRRIVAVHAPGFLYVLGSFSDLVHLSPAPAFLPRSVAAGGGVAAAACGHGFLKGAPGLWKRSTP